MNKKYLPDAAEPLAWYGRDAVREEKGRQLLAVRRIVQIPSSRPYELWATCAATTADANDPLHPRYWLTLHPTGSGTCTCPDQLESLTTGACKHLWGFRSLVVEWTRAGHITIPFHFPTSLSEAQEILVRNKVWYGSHYTTAVTHPSSAAFIACLGRDSRDAASPHPPSGMSTNLPSNGLSAPSLPPSTGITMHSLELEDQAALQHMAGDSSLLDPADLDFSDEEDTSGVGVIPQTSTMADNNFTANQHAIQLQTQQRLEQDIAKVLPLMHRISNLLINCTAASAGSSNIAEFSDLILVLNNQLMSRSRAPAEQAIEPHVSIPAESTAPINLLQNQHFPGDQTSGLFTKCLLPPSPELKQKRKQSHGVL